MARTQQEIYGTALEARGWKITKRLARGAVVMEHPSWQFKFYLGSHGSLRKGFTRAGSLPVGPIWFRDFLDSQVS